MRNATHFAIIQPKTCMKHHLPPLLFLMLLFGFHRSAAQPTITDQAMVQLGESAPVQFALGGFTPGATGANVAWDFSNLVDDTLAFTWTALDPQNTAFVDSFPNANLAFQAPVQGNGSNTWIYYHYDANAGSLDLHGSASLINDSTGVDTFFYLLTPNPKRVQTFPFTYSDSYVDGFSGLNHVNFGGFNFTQTRNGTIEVTADAWGSLVTPAGSFQNVLRIHTLENITDNFLTSVTTQEIHRYTWYSANEKYLLMHMDSIIVRPQFGPTSTSISMFYRDGAPTVGLEEADLAEAMGLELFPNPSQGSAHIRLHSPPSGPLHCSIHDLSGKSLRSYAWQSDGLPFLHEFDLSDLSPGVYFIQFQTSKGSVTQKLIKHP